MKHFNNIYNNNNSIILSVRDETVEEAFEEVLIYGMAATPWSKARSTIFFQSDFEIAGKPHSVSNDSRRTK